MVTARIAGLSPGTSPPPVSMPITPFFALLIDASVMIQYFVIVQLSTPEGNI
jgi:hypothetical protein